MMIQSGLFWVVLAVAAVVFWVIPQKVRMGFLAAVSIGFLAFGVSMGGGRVAALISTGSVLGWSMLFYWIAPRAARRRAAVARGAAASARGAALVHAGGSGGGSSVALLEEAPVSQEPRFSGRWILLVLVPPLVLYLVFFKYLLPAADVADGAWINLFVPLGLSYFTFKLIHYAVEVARGNIRERSLAQFLAWMFLFPAFTAGPIERFDHFLKNRELTFRGQLVIDGVTRIIHGLVKKMVLAEIILRPAFDFAANGQLVRELPRTPVWSVWLSAAVVYLYLYMDFSSYSDIAVGASRLFGLRIMENFNNPLLASNAADFWKRWHITLASWCQSYIYMPVLGLTRSPYIAVYVTFVGIGLWHEASWPWLVWGIYHATGVVSYQALARTMRARNWGSLDRGAWRIVCVPLTFVFVVVGTVLVFGGLHRFSDITHILERLVGMRVGHA